MKSLRPLERPPDRCVTGPHEAPGEDGGTRAIWRCELCGTESTDPRIREGCWNCDSAVLWR